VLQGGVSEMFSTTRTSEAVGSNPSEALSTLVPETKNTVAPMITMDARVKAKIQGYEGDSCGECGNYTLVRNGTCMKCNTCGATSGCS